MKEIISVQNPLIKEVYGLQQKKNRNQRGLFLIEGYKGVVEALKNGLDVRNIFISKDFNQDLPPFAEDKIFICSEQVLAKISTTESPPDIVAVASQLKYSIQDMFSVKNPLIIVLENIKDPGNLGTIIRTAKAANVSGVILTDNTVDIYNPKTVRSSSANLWKIPIVCLSEKTQIKEKLNKFVKNHFVATTVSQNKKQSVYYDISYNKPVVIMFGSEAEGISEELVEIADELITIPMNNEVESLNLSISVGIILYEAVRQRSLG